MLTLILAHDVRQTDTERQREYRVIDGGLNFLSSYTTAMLAKLKARKVPFQIVKSKEYYDKHLKNIA